MIGQARAAARRFPDFSYYDSAIKVYGGDVGLIYKLDPTNTELLREYLFGKYYGSVESMFYQERS